MTKEVVETMGWSGTVWAVGCKTREAALKVIDERGNELLVVRPLA